MDTRRARVITIQKARIGEEADRIDREFWGRLSPDERVEETWRLSLELWQFKGWDAGEQRLIALLNELSAAEARYLVIGAYAVTFHSRPRATRDLDLWVEPTAENAGRVIRALRAFGAPLQDLSEADLGTPAWCIRSACRRAVSTC